MCLAAGCAAVSYRCADPGAVDPSGADSVAVPVPGLVVSNPQLISEAGIVGRASIAGAAEGGIVYVSLAPKSLPAARKVEIANRNAYSPPTLVVSIVDGGFDPVAIEASEGDTLDLTTSMSDGRTEVMAVKVPAKRPPSVVRSNPSKGRTDVALNIIVEVVFSEPVNTNTVTTSSIQLRQAGRTVDGTVVLRGDSWEAEFAPGAQLDPDTPYEIVVTQDVQDFDGDALETEFSSTFVTGSARCSEVEGCQPKRSDESLVIAGTVVGVTGAGSHPVPGALISGWVRPATGSGHIIDPILTDARGNYTMTIEPNATVHLYAAADGFDQPCGTAVEPGSRTSQTEIELVASATSAVEGPLPRLSGRIYAGSQSNPVPGARVSFESKQGFVAVSATTTADGTFALCRLPVFGGQSLVVSKPGYATVKVPFAIAGGGDWGVYIGLRR